jgi:hypothetical protein
MIVREVDLLSEEGAKEYLKDLIQKLDEVDEDDFFGTEGWRHYFGLED